MEREEILSLCLLNSVALVTYIENLETELNDIKEEVRNLIVFLNQNSQNSNTSPSTDTLVKKKTQNDDKKSDRLPGGQKGHSGFIHSLLAMTGEEKAWRCRKEVMTEIGNYNESFHRIGNKSAWFPVNFPLDCANIPSKEMTFLYAPNGNLIVPVLKGGTECEHRP
ncbi:DUF6444 domain-containing protein [Methanosarcina sp. T3]|uniref:DUF6444 domain-containing protein n=1 Tax=Methanosarcina sp. T3 TaxID=3439062 RepID=UPI003F87C406